MALNSSTDYPTIELGGRTLVVRFSFAAQILLKRRYGIDPSKLKEALEPTNPDHGENLIKLFASMVAENFVDVDKPEAVVLTNTPTSDYWLTQVDHETIKAIDEVVSVSMGKAREAAKRAATSPIPIAS